MKSILVLTLLVASFSIYAKRNYISGVQKVTFRTGPGTDNKIVKMLETNEKVTLLEAGEKWSKVKDGEGNEGYVLNRFLTNEIPYINRYKWLDGKHKKLKETNENLNQQIAQMKTNITELQGQLNEKSEALNKTSSEFEELKTGSADYIGLKEKYDEAVTDLARQTAKVKALEETVNTHYIKWFMAGAGVLLLGWLIGVISRKKKRYTSSIRL